MNYRLNFFIKKYIYLLLIFCFFFAMLIYSGSVDPFIFKHMVVIQKIINNGFIPEFDKSQIPGFYALGAILVSVTGITTESLNYFPVQLFPLILLFFCTANIISCNKSIAFIITLCYVCRSTSGSMPAFFWPHGLGEIYLFIFIYIFIIYTIKSRKNIKSDINFYICNILIIVATIYISYNITAKFFIIIVAMLVIINITDKYYINKNTYINVLVIFLIILIIVEFGLFNFIYYTFIPTLSNIDFSLNVIYKFFISYIGTTNYNNEVNYFIYNFPIEITFNSIIKYLSIYFILFMFVIKTLNKLTLKKCINLLEILIFSIFISEVAFSVHRFMIGGIPVANMFLPSIFVLLYYFKTYKNIKILVSVIISILIFTTFSGYLLYENNGLIERYVEKKTSVIAASIFLNEFTEQGIVITSDIATSGIFKMKNIINNYNNSYYNQYYNILTLEDILYLTDRCDGIIFKSNKYYIFNFNLKLISINNWISLDNIKIYKNINYNNLYKIYTNKYVEIIY